MANIKEKVGAAALAIFVSFVISIGIKWVLSFLIIPLLFILVFLGIRIDITPEIISSRLSIVSFFAALIYIVYGDILIKKRK